MLKVGLTGGLASGKSVIGEVFVSLGAKLIKADDIAHNLMKPGLPVYEEVVRHFGREILHPDKTINRKALATAAFGGEPSCIRELNAIVHPAVLRAQEEWMEQEGKDNPSSIVMVEAALILEAGARSQFDCMIVVTCKPEQRVQRLAQRLGISLQAATEEVERRMATQLSDDEKVKAADYVIDNSGSRGNSETLARQIFMDLLRRAQSSTNAASVQAKIKT